MTGIGSVISKIRKFASPLTGYEEVDDIEAPKEMQIGPNEVPVIPHIVDPAIEATAHTHAGELVRQQAMNPMMVGNTNAPAFTFANDATTDFGASTVNAAFQIITPQPVVFHLSDQLAVQEDGKIIISSELKRNMTDLAEDFWKEVAKRFPTSSQGLYHIEYIRERVKAAMDVCEVCDDGTCTSCEILKTAMQDHIAPEILEKPDAPLQSGDVGVIPDASGIMLAETPEGVLTTGNTADMVGVTPTVNLDNKENDNE